MRARKRDNFKSFLYIYISKNPNDFRHDRPKLFSNSRLVASRIARICQFLRKSRIGDVAKWQARINEISREYDDRNSIYSPLAGCSRSSDSADSSLISGYIRIPISAHTFTGHHRHKQDTRHSLASDNRRRKREQRDIRSVKDKMSRRPTATFYHRETLSRTSTDLTRLHNTRAIIPRCFRCSFVRDIHSFTDERLRDTKKCAAMYHDRRPACDYASTWRRSNMAAMTSRGGKI